MIPIADRAKWAVPALVGLFIIAAIAIWFNRGSHLTVEGKVLKVRVIPTDDNASIAVVDYRILNPANVQLMVREISIELTLDDGTKLTSVTMPEMDLDRVLGYFKNVGPRYNPVLKPKDRVKGGVEVDRTAASSFEVNSKRLESRKNLVVRILDVDGPVLEVAEHPAK